MPTRRDNRGFVLLMVLVVLAIGGSLLAVVAHRATGLSTEAGAAARNLQRKWGFRGLQTVYLGRAEEILVRHTSDLGPPPIAVRENVVLGGTEFDLVVSDEQAKANVNLVAARRDRDGLRACLSALSAGRWPLQVILRPVLEKSGVIRSVPELYASLEQVFTVSGPLELLGTDSVGGPAQRVTCWGSGKVNFRRAEAAVLQEVLTPVLDEYEVHQICLLREAMPTARLSEVLAQLELEKDTRAEAEKLLADGSSCHSLWIVVRGRTRDWHRLYVRQVGDAENDAGSWTLDWGP